MAKAKQKHTIDSVLHSLKKKNDVRIWGWTVEVLRETPKNKNKVKGD